MPLLLALAAAAASPQPGELRTFTDWIVGCDNGHACQAVALMPEFVGIPELCGTAIQCGSTTPTEADHPVTMVMRRGPEPNAAVTAFINVGDVEAAYADGGGLRIRLSPARHGAASIPPAEVPKLIAALRVAPKLQLRTAAGEPSGIVSLAGASAALLYMDQAQKRVGTVTALVRPGVQPPPSVRPPPALPIVIERKPAHSDQSKPISLDQVAAARKRFECDPDLSNKDYPVETHSLDDRTDLYLIRCFQAAYNGSSLVLIAERRDASNLRPALFDFDASVGERTGDDVPPEGAFWDAETRRLGSYFKGRGLGDCGASQEWAWDGNRFRLIHAEAMGECRGSADYITTWRAEVR